MLLRNMRRVHHLDRLVARNLQHAEVSGPVNCYYTLTIDGQSEPFYVSDVAIQTLNPSWDSIQIAVRSASSAPADTAAPSPSGHHRRGSVVESSAGVPQTATRMMVRVYQETRTPTWRLKQDLLHLGELDGAVPVAAATTSASSSKQPAGSQDRLILQLMVDFSELECIVQFKVRYQLLHALDAYAFHL